MPPTLFRRVSKYRANGSLDPRENRLTEVTGSVLERVPGLVTFVGDVLAGGTAVSDRAASFDRSGAYETVGTQVPVDGRFVDLVLTSTTPDGSVRTTYIEIKHGSGEHGDQIDAYLRSAGGRESDVALLVPRRDVFALRRRTRSVPITAWETLAAAIRRWEPSPRLTDVERWLVDEYLRYLREEDLMDPGFLTTSHALALAEIGAANAAMRAICARADAVIDDRWGPRGEHLRSTGAGRDPKHGLGYWAHYSRSEAGTDWAPGWLEWGLRDLSDAEYADALADYEDILFCVGATFGAADKPEGSEWGRAWLGALQARHPQDPFVTFWHSGFYRVMRVLRPSSLLPHRTIEAQGDAVGSWVNDTFEALWAAQPPSLS